MMSRKIPSGMWHHHYAELDRLGDGDALRLLAITGLILARRRQQLLLLCAIFAKQKPKEGERAPGPTSSLGANKDDMKRDVILLVDADADTASVVGSAAALLNLDVRFARTSRELFQLIPNGLEEVAVIVLDVDPGVHAMAALEALDVWRPAPPVIVLSSLEEAHLHPVAITHGARECLGKPVSVLRVKRAIAQFARAREAHGRW